MSKYISFSQALSSTAIRQLNYKSLLRKSLVVDMIGNNIPRYSVDKIQETVVLSDRIGVINQKNIAVDVPLNNIKIIALNEQDSHNSINTLIDIENKSFLNLLTKAIKHTKNILTQLELNSNTFKQLFNDISSKFNYNDVLISKIFVNTSFYYDTLINNLDRTRFDPCTHKELINVGLVGHYAGADILVNDNIQRGLFYCVPDTEFLGVMAIKQDCMALERAIDDKIEIMTTYGAAITGTKYVYCGMFLNEII